MSNRLQLTILFLLGSLAAQAQAPDIQTSLPTVMQPSPTVGALMKFEEVPVSNYTGIPDISIPLFGSATRSKDIKLDIALKYHPASVNANERASNVGLGWSLFAGGTISRTVRGLPDEYLKTGTIKCGIYHTDGTPRNNYYRVVSHMDGTSSLPQTELSEFLFEAHEKKAYDSEHDLWQFEFMGQSGRFYIKKNMETGLLEVVKLGADNALKIVNHYNTASGQLKYSPTSFTIFDDRGYSYIFDVSEETTTGSTSFVTYIDGSSGSSMEDELRPYSSAFHMTRVYDPNGSLLLECSYNPFTKETVHDKSTTESLITSENEQYLVHQLSISGCPASDYEPKMTYQLQRRDTKVRTLSEIRVEGIARISFNYVQGRTDTDMWQPQNSYVFKGITVRDWNSTPVKQVQLEHAYLYGLETRLGLSKVHFGNFENALKETYELSYREDNFGTGDNGTIYKDPWGYQTNRKDPAYSTINLLQKMSMPTGGCIIYNFEPNQYTYVGDTPVTNFDGNPENWVEAEVDSQSFTVANAAVRKYLFTLTEAQTAVTFNANVFMTGNQDALEWQFNLYRVDATAGGGTVDVPIQGGISRLICNSNDCTNTVELGPGLYKASFSTLNTWSPDVAFTSATLHMSYRYHAATIKPFLYGGGNRIRRVGFFEDMATPKDYYERPYPAIIPQREKKYNYDFFEGAPRSSGSLVYYEPLFVYTAARNVCIACGIYQGPRQVTYRYTTTLNNLSSIRTQGADVGYKNVTVFETGNGRQAFTYSSPIDFPNTDANPPTPPFLPEPSIDYKRGLLQNEKMFNAAGQLLSESAYSAYLFDEYQERTGLSTLYNGFGCGRAAQSKSYALYFAAMSHCTDCSCFCGDAPAFIGTVYNYEAFGWVRGMTKTTTEYFHEPAGQRSLQRTETTRYNSVNKKIESTAVTNPLESLATSYFYHTGNSPFSQNRISELESIESRRNSELVSKSTIEYSNAWTGNSAYLPKSIWAAVGSNPLEKRIAFSYDSHGNITQAMQEGGMPVSYVWGYHMSLPVAKIDNLDYASIPPALITAVQAASDAVPYSEQNLVSALAALRNSTALAAAQTTTYTYRPLVGITGVTDPKGDRTTFEYDAFGRLKAVRDNDGKLLSENEYHYRTQP